MSRLCSTLPAVLFAVATFTALQAQTATISIPAWIETNDPAPTPKFEASINGEPAPVTAQLGPTSDQIILLVFDLTGELSLIEAAKQATLDEISKLPQTTWVGLLRAQDGLHVLADPGPDRQPLIDAIRALPNSGKPGLLETVQPALSLADAIIRKSPVRVSVLYITDSNIYSYREDYTNPVINSSDPHDLSRRFPEALVKEKISKLAGNLGSLQAPLFVVHINYRRDRVNEAYQNGLETLASTTGGKGQICRSIAETSEAISAMFARISSAWRLTLTVPPKANHDTQIQLSAPRPQGDLRLSWRTRFHLKGG
jgi:hypothetical protein